MMNHKAGRCRRALGWLLAILAALVLVAWVASVRAELIYFWSSTLRFGIAEGRCRAAVTSNALNPTSLSTWWQSRGQPMHTAMWFWSTAPRFRWDFESDYASFDQSLTRPDILHTVYVPGWSVAAVLGLASWGFFRLAHVHPLARFRRKTGQCPTCGYDRTGLSENGPCPECGKGV